MVSTGMETAYATVSGPGFDSQQVHCYFSSLYSGKTVA